MASGAARRAADRRRLRRLRRRLRANDRISPAVRDGLIERFYAGDAPDTSSKPSRDRGALSRTTLHGVFN